MTISDPTVLWLKEQVYDSCGFELTAYQEEEESSAYCAARFKLNGKTTIFRKAKITPKKTGQFVTVWKRNEKGVTVPFQETDQIDLVVIFVASGHQKGTFIFPGRILIEKKIISSAHIEGKRGIRVYPPWDAPKSKQAIQTQKWQCLYFVSLDSLLTTEIEQLKKKYK
ncbi:MepB family protein [Aquimarina hainanensis]|uniref:MepB family protein n=1 Tax=Aquimarina hainanensis TaxID=1578017 RepID=A0ABW5NBZ0_9FLAO|nr:MepB family protein [Aquimarina sp. TRL1]